MRAGYAREIINPFYPCKMELDSVLIKVRNRRLQAVKA